MRSGNLILSIALAAMGVCGMHIPGLSGGSTHVAHAGMFVIDDFMGPEYVDFSDAPFLAAPGHSTWGWVGSPQVLQSDDDAILGGQRDLWLNVTEIPPSAQTSSWVTAGSNGNSEQLIGGALLFGSAHPGTGLCLQYDGDGEVEEDFEDGLFDAQALGKVDLTDGGENDRFQLAFDYIDAGSINDATLHFEVKVASDTGGWAHYMAMIPESQTDAFVYDVPFSEFTFHDGADASLFTEADSITFFFNDGVEPLPDGDTTLDVDFRLTQIATAVPEPGSMLLAAAGFAVLAAAGRRRRRRALG